MDERLARLYRQARHEEWNGLSATPAQWAMVKARAHIRGSELYGASEDADWHGEYARHWHEDIGAGLVVDIWQVSDSESCDCWEWAKENPRDDGREDDIPPHGHFGIVAETTWNGREIAHDACWGFVWDWPGVDDDRELAHAYDEIAQPAIDHARGMLAALPQWVREQVAAWEEVA